MKLVEVTARIEAGCDVNIGEYSLDITGFIGALDISSVGGVGDITLIKECAEEAITSGNYPLPKDGVFVMRLGESGEWEDVFWHKYYVVDSYESVEY